MITFLKAFLIAVWFWMIYVVIATSLESSLIEEWSYLGSIPWMRATLWDFYANIVVIYLWVLYREKTIAVKILWGVLFFCLGSIGSIGYLLIQLFTLKEADDLAIVLKPKA